MFTLLVAFALAAPVPAPTPDWVTVKGTVVWPAKAELPERKVIEPKGPESEYVKLGGPLTDDRFVIDTKCRGLKDVVVWLRPNDDDPEAVIPQEKVHPDLKNAKPATHTITGEFCRYDRRVIAARTGDTLEVKYKSKVAMCFDYNDGINWYGKTLPHPTDVLRYRDLQTTKLGTFCDSIYPWARGFVRVFDHPYFATTNEHGQFEIKQVPKGKWRLVCWHEGGYHTGKAGRLGFAVNVDGKTKGEMTLDPLEFDAPKPK